MADDKVYGEKNRVPFPDVPFEGYPDKKFDSDQVNQLARLALMRVDSGRSGDKGKADEIPLDTKKVGDAIGDLTKRAKAAMAKGELFDADAIRPNADPVPLAGRPLVLTDPTPAKPDKQFVVTGADLLKVAQIRRATEEAAIAKGVRDGTIGADEKKTVSTTEMKQYAAEFIKDVFKEQKATGGSLEAAYDKVRADEVAKYNALKANLPVPKQLPADTLKQEKMSATPGEPAKARGRRTDAGSPDTTTLVADAGSRIPDGVKSGAVAGELAQSAGLDALASLANAANKKVTDLPKGDMAMPVGGKSVV